MTLAAMSIGIALGFVGALAALSRWPWLRGLVRAYLGFFRGVPVLVQIVFWYDAVGEMTHNAINLPALVAGVIALGINEGDYMTEIVRAGLISFDPGQRDAARALGMTRPTTMRRVILPQALRIIIPPTGNQFISMMKTTSLLFTIAVPEIFGRGTDIYSQNFKYFEVLCVVSLWYLFLTALLVIAQQALALGAGAHRANAIAHPRPRSLARLLAALRTRRMTSAHGARSAAKNGAGRRAASGKAVPGQQRGEHP